MKTVSIFTLAATIIITGCSSAPVLNKITGEPLAKGHYYDYKGDEVNFAGKKVSNLPSNCTMEAADVFVCRNIAKRNKELLTAAQQLKGESDMVSTLSYLFNNQH
jgi:hypothetical protein